MKKQEIINLIFDQTSNYLDHEKSMIEEQAKKDILKSFKPYMKELNVEENLELNDSLDYLLYDFCESVVQMTIEQVNELF